MLVSIKDSETDLLKESSLKMIRKPAVTVGKMPVVFTFRKSISKISSAKYLMIEENKKIFLKKKISLYD